ncbi:hypothetical protein [Xenorhabdus szentirmaii]|uniref:hypothetical protein n=1 Tax=Xenorhabdus szentirmaii TaxID=290112 RepID=UPI002B400503|nr:hypothetical protein [Xenorhabdus sp. 38]
MQQLINPAGNFADFSGRTNNPFWLSFLKNPGRRGRLKHIAGISAIGFHHVPHARRNMLGGIILIFRATNAPQPRITGQDLALFIRELVPIKIRRERIQQCHRIRIRLFSRSLNAHARFFRHTKDGGRAF